VLFAVVEPMTCATSTNDPLQLVRFDPDEFIDTLVPTRVISTTHYQHNNSQTTGLH